MSSMEFKDWMGDKLPRYRAFCQELRKLDSEFNPECDEHRINLHTERDMKARLQYKHDIECYRNRDSIFELARQGKLEIRTPADVMRIHSMLFCGQENAGRFNPGSSRLCTIKENEEDGIISTFAKPEQRDEDLSRAFDDFYAAMEDEPALAPVFIACLYMKLLNIHPFIDGNGRTGRIVIQILLYQYGFEHGLDIAFEECFNRFNSICLEKLPVVTEYRYYIDFEPMVPFLLKLIRTSYIYFENDKE